MGYPISDRMKAEMPPKRRGQKPDSDGLEEKEVHCPDDRSVIGKFVGQELGAWR